MRILVGLLSLFLTGCVFYCTESDPGVGDACSVRECGVTSPSANGNTICEPATACDTLICIAQGKGEDPNVPQAQGANSGEAEQFCSMDCQVDEECPSGFECRSVSEIGANQGRTMCLRPL